jgi:RNA polymerase sigma-B factor
VAPARTATQEPTASVRREEREAGRRSWADSAEAWEMAQRGDIGTVSNEELVRRYQATGAEIFLDQLLSRNERLLHHVLKRFSQSDEPYEDLFQAAWVGLVKAARRYDPERGSLFATYAVALIDGEVRHHVRDSLLVKQPRWARSLYSRIQTAQSEFAQDHSRPPTITELASEVNLCEEGVLEIIRLQYSLNIQSLDEAGGEPSRHPDRGAMHSLRQESFSLPIEDRILLYEALAALSDLHRKIIYLLFFDDLTQQQVAEHTGLSQRAVSRELSKALARLKVILSKRIF